MMKKNVSLVVIILLLAITSAKSQEYKVRMAFVGNSITQGVYGYGKSSIDTSYASQFGKLMEEVYGDTLDILNAGVSGRTMMKAADVSISPIWNEAVFATAIKTVPDICFILLGTNDSKPDLFANLQDRFFDDYMSMIDTFKFRNPDTKFIICRPTPIWDGHPYSQDSPHNDTILLNYTIPLIDSVAKMQGTYLLDLHAPFVDSVEYFDDSLHPNRLGHKKMAKILFDWFIQEDMMHQIETGKAFVADFKQSPKIIGEGQPVTLSWTTIYADSVFLNEEFVETTGSKVVTAEKNKSYTLTAKGSKNVSDFELKINAYEPIKTSILIETSSRDYRNGDSIYLYSYYKDQNNVSMIEKTQNIVWSTTEGEARFGTQTDTSVVFLPRSTGKIIIQASDGEVTGEKALTISSILSAENILNEKPMKVYPNPVDETLFIEVGNPGQSTVDVTVYNITGEQIMTSTYNVTDLAGHSISMNMEGFNKGVYIYEINTDINSYKGQFIKK